MNSLMKYFLYSGLSIIFQLNPVQWSFVPKFTKEQSPWDDNAYIFSFLFLTVRLWIDDGSW